MKIEITSVKVVKIERKGSAVIGYADICCTWNKNT